MHADHLSVQDQQPLRIVDHPTAQRFLAAAEPWLLQSEAEHNMLLGFATSMARSNNPLPPDALLAAVQQGDAIVGCISRIPPHKVGLTRLPIEAVPLVLEHVLALYESLPGVVGPDPVAYLFAKLWAERYGLQTRCTRHHRIYQLDRVIWPERTPPGSMRLATPDDLPLLRQWVHEFGEEVGLPDAGAPEIADERLRNNWLFVWDDDGAKCMASLAGPTQNGIRVTHVYTPLASRGRGYAGICTAALSQRALDEGRRFTMLYTDMNNPTSNAVYQRIGYVPIGDVFDWEFVPGAG